MGALFAGMFSAGMLVLAAAADALGVWRSVIVVTARAKVLNEIMEVCVFGTEDTLRRENIPRPIARWIREAGSSRGLQSAASAAPAELLPQLGSNVDGLPWREAERRLAEVGPNEIASQRPPSWAKVLWHAIRDPFNGVLFVLCVVSASTDDSDAVVVMRVMMTVSVLLRFWHENKSVTEAELLRQIVRTNVTVLRRENAARVDRKASVSSGTRGRGPDPCDDKSRDCWTRVSH